MTVAQNIVLADAATTPVNHTFVPMGPDRSGSFWFVDRSRENAIGYWRISVKIALAGTPRPGQSSKDRVSRVTVSLHEPELETLSNGSASGIAPAPQVAYINRANHEFILPERGGKRGRQDLRKMSAQLLADATIVDVIENLSYLQ